MNTDYYSVRRTLDEPVTLEGVGLHSGRETGVELLPVDEPRGLWFHRRDEASAPEIPARVDSVRDTRRSTTLGTDGSTVQTVEHLLSALYGTGITDLRVEVDGPEVPALDGSAAPFVRAIDGAGSRKLEEGREIHRVEDPVFVQRSDASLVILPAPELQVDCTIQYDNPGIGDQFYSLVLTPERYREEIAPARTYGFKEEAEELFERDLALGGSLDNAIVVDEEGGFLGEGPRWEDEFVCHKILDLLGDLCLTGTFLVGRVVAVKPSHGLNRELVESAEERYRASVPDELDRSEGTSLSFESLDIQDIKQVLPHRYPFLLIDRVLSVDYENMRAVGLKNVTTNEEFFQGHFPHDPIMPGVLVIEAMAQLGAACILKKPRYEGMNSYFMGLNDVKWRRPVRPGDQLYFEIEGRRMKSRYGTVDGVARVNGELAAEATLKFAIVDE